MSEPQEIMYEPVDDDDRTYGGSSYRGQPLTEAEKANLREYIKYARKRDIARNPHSRSYFGRRAEIDSDTAPEPRYSGYDPDLAGTDLSEGG